MNIYYPKTVAVDHFQLNLKVQILPLTCEHLKDEGLAVDEAFLDVCSPEAEVEQLVIYNKVRERFNFEVYHELTIKGVTFDALDSILPRGTSCLSENRPCCKFEEGEVSNFDPTDSDFNCKQAFEQLDLSDQC
mmetsp:Transcript_33860/g.52195  ORF Transcript_33860/g.52195 Transcript_33860/m.52195 type:complete len:133 (-) Transcript_33860:27-425(-)